MAEKVSYVKGGIDFADYTPIHLRQARDALLENAKILDPAKDQAIWNLNVAALYLVQSIAQIRDDVNLLHNKLQPILKQIADEARG